MFVLNVGSSLVNRKQKIMCIIIPQCDINMCSACMCMYMFVTVAIHVYMCLCVGKWK